MIEFTLKDLGKKGESSPDRYSHPRQGQEDRQMLAADIGKTPTELTREILATQSSVQTDISWILIRKILADTIEDQLR